MTEQQLSYWLAATLTPGLHYQTVLNWITSRRDVANLFSASSQELARLGLSAEEIHAIHHPNWHAVDAVLRWRNTLCHVITLTDIAYPSLLKEIADPPLVLYVQGNAQACLLPQLAIVGARTPTPIGIQTAERFASHLAQHGLAVTSGLALGIDGASHRGALAVSGVTIAVFGTGLKCIYPKTHRQLAEQILANEGALVSELPLLTAPQGRHFPRRNRIISGLSLGVLVVEAALQSGSLVTARHALEQGREVFAIPGSIHHPLSRGCHHLIRQGAKLVETAEHIFEELTPWNHLVIGHTKKTVAKSTLPVLDLSYQRLLTQIDCAITALDGMRRRRGVTANELSSMLLRLELQGYIQAVSGGYVRVIT